MGQHGPYATDFVWSMDDSRHLESTRAEMSEDQVDELQLFIETKESSYQHRWRKSQASSSTGPNSVAELVGRDPTLNEAPREGDQAPAKRASYGLDELSDQLEVTVYNLGDLE